MEGRAWVFGDNVDTDNIFPTRFGGDPTLEDMAKHVFFDFRPEFAKNAKPGDVVVAGHNFGCGSHRETAVLGIKALGIEVIVARSFARAFYRNAINNALRPIIIGDLPFECEDGAILDVDPVSGVITNKSTGIQVRGQPISGIAVKIVEGGGATKFFKNMVVHPENEPPVDIA
ncbi:MAG: 3-isopropylmalate dehydratase [Firmicutes bacterium]|nr:3-isopropylmalate dehydratase [Bacillota bacterium]